MLLEHPVLRPASLMIAAMTVALAAQLALAPLFTNRPVETSFSPLLESAKLPPSAGSPVEARRPDQSVLAAKEKLERLRAARPRVPPSAIQEQIAVLERARDAYEQSFAEELDLQKQRASRAEDALAIERAGRMAMERELSRLSAELKAVRDSVVVPWTQIVQAIGVIGGTVATFAMVVLTWRSQRRTPSN